jgi:hypothetical protein
VLPDSTASDDESSIAYCSSPLVHSVNGAAMNVLQCYHNSGGTGNPPGANHGRLMFQGADR